jgi:hypothetical protein
MRTLRSSAVPEVLPGGGPINMEALKAGCLKGESRSASLFTFRESGVFSWNGALEWETGSQVAVWERRIILERCDLDDT